MISKIIKGEGKQDSDTLIKFNDSMREALAGPGGCKGYDLIHLSEFIFERCRFADSMFNKTTISAIAILEEK